MACVHDQKDMLRQIRLRLPLLHMKGVPACGGICAIPYGVYCTVNINVCHGTHNATKGTLVYVHIGWMNRDGKESMNGEWSLQLECRRERFTCVHSTLSCPLSRSWWSSGRTEPKAQVTSSRGHIGLYLRSVLYLLLISKRD